MTLKRILAMVLAVVILLSAVLSTVTAETEYTEGPYTYTVTDGEASITAADKSIKGDIVIPDTLGGYPVTSIGDFAFEGRSLKSIALPDSVQSIGEGAFKDCNALNSFVIPNGVTEINPSTFSNCGSLESVTVPNSVTSIGDLAFWCSRSLKSIALPDSIQSFGNGVFAASGITHIEIPEGVTAIPGVMFEFCDSLTSIVIPKSVQRIDEYAFSYTALSEIELYCHTSLVRGALYNCYANISIIHGDDSRVVQVEAKEPTYTEYGWNAYEHCINCDYSTFEKIPKLRLPGDANGDGKVTINDTSDTLKHIAGWDVQVDTDTADVDGDGKATISDVSLILKYIAKWDVELK